jgi:hypothetical protein
VLHEARAKALAGDAGGAAALLPNFQRIRHEPSYQ